MSSHAHLGAVFDHAGNQLYGMNAEIFLKMEAKRDKKWERSVLEWVQEVVGEELADLDEIWLSLKSGVILCKLVNKIKPGTIKKYSTTRLVALIERDNIDLFLGAMWKFGIKSSDLFQTSDLYGQKNLASVFSCLAALSEMSPKLGWTGPIIKKSTTESSGKAYSGKKWESVETAPKRMHIDDMRKENTPENELIRMQIQLNEVSIELKKTKAEKYTMKQEMNSMKDEMKNLEKGVGKKSGAFHTKVETISTQTLEQEKKKLEEENEKLKLEQERQMRALKAKQEEVELQLNKTKEEKQKLNAAMLAMKKEIQEIQKENQKTQNKTSSTATTQTTNTSKNVQKVENDYDKKKKTEEEEYQSHGFYSDVPSDMLNSAKALLTNVVMGMDLTQSNTQQNMLAMFDTEDGRRAFCFVLNEVVEKTTEVNQLTAEAASSGVEMYIHSTGKSRPKHKKLVKVDKKTNKIQWELRFGFNKTLDLINLKDIIKGKLLHKYWENCKKIEDGCCLTIVMKDDSDIMNVSFETEIERNNFYWILQNIYHSIRLEMLHGIRHNCLVIPEDNFHVISALTDSCLCLMNLQDQSKHMDMNSIMILMKCSTRICFEKEDLNINTVNVRSSLSNSKFFIFIQDQINHHFRSLSPKFWEAVFWCETVQNMRAYKIILEENDLNYDNNEVNIDIELSSESQLIDLVENILLWSPCLWDWSLDNFDIKEFMKIMHGGRVNNISDEILFDLFKFVDAVGTRAGEDRKVSGDSKDSGSESENDSIRASIINMKTDISHRLSVLNPKKRLSMNSRNNKARRILAQRHTKIILNKLIKEKMPKLRRYRGSFIEENASKTHIVGMDEAEEE